MSQRRSSSAKVSLDEKSLCELNDYFADLCFDNEYKNPTLAEITDEALAPEISERHVWNCLQHLKKTATGPDQVPFWIWKDHAEIFTPVISKIWNMSLKSSTWPLSWKRSHVTPLPKVEVPKIKSDYRAINITPVIARAFEKSVYNIHARNVVEKNLSPTQFAYRTCGSSTDALVCMQHAVYSYLDNPNCKAVRLFAMDFSKAFDYVNHEKLSVKLKRLELNPFITNWYINFLTNRKQRIIFNSFEGQWKGINRGTTQGSVSGPYLFNIFINDLEISLDNQPALFKYADDTTIVIPVWSKSPSRTDLVEQYFTWSSENNMICNTSKCKELVLRKKGFNENIPSIYNIPQCKKLKILGVTFQENCKYREHVRSKLFKANKSLYILRTLRKEGLRQDELDYLFNSLVLPNFTYGLSVYGANDSELTNIQQFLDRCFKRKFTSVKVNIRDLLENTDKKLYKSRSSLSNTSYPINNIFPEKKITKYFLRNNTAIRPTVNTERFKNVFVNRLIFKYNAI